MDLQNCGRTNHNPIGLDDDYQKTGYRGKDCNSCFSLEGLAGAVGSECTVRNGGMRCSDGVGGFDGSDGVDGVDGGFNGLDWWQKAHQSASTRGVPIFPVQCG